MKSLEFKGLDENENKIYVCPMCGYDVSVASHLFYGKCKACEATIIDYVPAPHQEAFHKSDAKFKLNIGGYGSGKTTASCGEITAHIISTPNGKTLITAPTLQQVDEAIMPELDKFIPPWLYERPPTKKPNYYAKLKNGHEIVVFSSKDDEKLRSLNLTAFYIEEASSVPFSTFIQLKARLRNVAGKKIDKDGNEISNCYLGIICSNPEFAWFVPQFLLLSSDIFASKNVNIHPYKKLKSSKSIERSYHTFLSSSRDNIRLPNSFIRDLSINRGSNWIAKYIDCSIEMKDGAVYPDFTKCIVEPIPIPDHWLRCYGYDKGLRDQTAMACGAVDPMTGIVYIYDEYYVANMPVSYHAKVIPPMIKPYKLLFPVQADPTIQQRSDRDGRSYRNYFYSLTNIMLDLANNDIDYGIERVRDYMYLGKLKFFSSLENLKMEAIGYTFKDNEDNTKAILSGNKPIDKNNHLLDALRYLVVRLPVDPKSLLSVDKGTKNKYVLEDDDETLVKLNKFEGENIFGVGVYDDD